MGRERVDIGDIDLEAMAIFTGVDVGTLRVRLDPAELAAKLEAARTVEELWEVYRWTPRWSAIAKTAFVKLEHGLRKRLESATSLEELLALRELAPWGSTIERVVLMKTEMRLRTELEAARTVEELWALREFAPRGSAIERELLTKTEMLLRTELESATSLEELRGVCRSGRGTIVEREALLKMAPFFPKKDAT
jgi:hypothetical protein